MHISESGTCNKSTNFVDGLGGPIDLIDQNENAFSLEKQNAYLSLLSLIHISEPTRPR